MACMDRREQMRALLARREHRGLTFSELSRESGIPAGTLASWAWKLRQPRSPNGGRARRASFVELVAAPSPEPVTADAGRIEIVLRGERRVVVDAGFDAEALARVVKTLEQC